MKMIWETGSYTLATNNESALKEYTVTKTGEMGYPFDAYLKQGMEMDLLDLKNGFYSLEKLFIKFNLREDVRDELRVIFLHSNHLKRGGILRYYCSDKFSIEEVRDL